MRAGAAWCRRLRPAACAPGACSSGGGGAEAAAAGALHADPPAPCCPSPPSAVWLEETLKNWKRILLLVSHSQVRCSAASERAGVRAPRWRPGAACRPGSWRKPEGAARLRTPRLRLPLACVPTPPRLLCPAAPPGLPQRRVHQHRAHAPEAAQVLRGWVGRAVRMLVVALVVDGHGLPTLRPAPPAPCACAACTRLHQTKSGVTNCTRLSGRGDGSNDPPC